MERPRALVPRHPYHLQEQLPRVPSRAWTPRMVARPRSPSPCGYKSLQAAAAPSFPPAAAVPLPPPSCSRHGAPVLRCSSSPPAPPYLLQSRDDAEHGPLPCPASALAVTRRLASPRCRFRAPTSAPRHSSHPQPCHNGRHAMDEPNQCPVEPRPRLRPICHAGTSTSPPSHRGRPPGHSRPHLSCHADTVMLHHAGWFSTHARMCRRRATLPRHVTPRRRPPLLAPGRRQCLASTSAVTRSSTTSPSHEYDFVVPPSPSRECRHPLLLQFSVTSLWS